MTILLPLTIGILFGIGTYLILRKNVIKLILGLGIISHATNMLLITSGWLGRGAVPILGKGDDLKFVDPIPQALILTAIVIGFAATAFILVLAYRVYSDLKTDNLEKLRGQRG